MKSRAPLKTEAFGTCAYSKTSPNQTTLSSDTKILNIFLTFEEALKINLAIDECVRSLNEYSRSTTAGKRKALNLCIHFDKQRISIHEGKV